MPDAPHFISNVVLFLTVSQESDSSFVTLSSGVESRHVTPLDGNRRIQPE